MYSFRIAPVKGIEEIQDIDSVLSLVYAVFLSLQKIRQIICNRFY